jgi:hypothetical protein
MKKTLIALTAAAGFAAAGLALTPAAAAPVAPGQLGLAVELTGNNATQIRSDRHRHRCTGTSTSIAATSGRRARGRSAACRVITAIRSGAGTSATTDPRNGAAPRPSHAPAGRGVFLKIATPAARHAFAPLIPDSFATHERRRSRQ